MNLSMINRTSVFRNNPIKLFVRSKHKMEKKSEPDQVKVSTELLNHLKKHPKYSNIIDKIPQALLKKYRNPELLYLINKDEAKNIFKIIKNNINTNSPLVEVNPGFCYLTEELLKGLDKNIYIYESSNNFTCFFEELKKKYEDRVVYKVANFFAMGKLAFQDKMDQGNRVRELLGELATEDRSRVLQIIGVMQGLSFMRYLLSTLLFHHSTNLLGQVDLYLVMAGPHYEFLADSKIQSCKFIQLPALFQLLFDFKVLGRVPKLDYLPWTYPSNKKISILNEDFMYIVNIKQKEKLPCRSDYLPVLWYFFRPQLISQSTRVIPMLEQWIPGCGVWLITGQDPPDVNKELAPNQDDAQLPHMTIFTEFGDLNLAQKLTVFKRFISFPEFDHCPFKVTMEGNLPKSITAAESNKELSGTHIDVDEDESETSDSETES